MSMTAKVGGGVLVAALGLGGLYMTRRVEAASSQLPGCETVAVQEAAQSIAEKQVSVPFRMTSFATVEAETTAQRVACRAQVVGVGADTSSTWVKFTVERQGETDLFLQFHAND